MSANYFISDTHFGHKNICKYRTQFATTEEHDELIFNNIMECSGKRNNIWMLGDLFFTEESMSKYWKILDNFMNVNVIFGNHCTDNAQRLKNAREIAATAHSFGALFKYKGLWLSHAPLHPDELRGCPNVFGHIHANSLDDSRYFNVSCENINYKPITLDELRSKL